MSKGLVKQMFTVLQPEEKRLISADELIQRRQEEFARWHSESSEPGFVPGLSAEEIELADGEDGAEGSVIKSRQNADQIVESAQAQAQAILDDARAQAAAIIEEAQAQAEAQSGMVLEGARQQGYSEGQMRAKAEEEAIRQEYREKERQLELYYEEQIAEMEPQMVEVITAVYEQIFHVELDSYREILGHLISDALRKIEGGHDFMVHVSKEDYPYVSLQKKQILAGAVAANCNVDVVEDLTLSKNECFIETDSGIYDCGLGTQLEGLRKKLQLLSWQRG